MAGGNSTATFVTELKDETSGPASNAASALDRLKAKIQEEQAAIRDTSSALSRLKGNTSEVTEAKKTLGQRLQIQRASLSGAQAQYVKLGGSLKGLNEKTKEHKSAIDGLLPKLDKWGVTSEGAGTSANMAALGAAGAAAAILALEAVVIACAAKLISFAIAAADAARTAGLLRTAFTGSAESGENLGLWVQKLGTNLPIARSKINDVGRSLIEAQLGGENFSNALRAITTTAAVLGDSAGAKIQAIAEQSRVSGRVIITSFNGLTPALQGTGVGIEDVAGQLAKITHTTIPAATQALARGGVRAAEGLEAVRRAVEAKLGPIAAQMALSLPNQIDKAKESLSALFTGLKVDPLLEALHTVLGLLDQNTASGRALKSLAENILQPLINQAAKAGPFVKNVFRGMIIVALGAGIVFFKLETQLKKLIPPSMRPNIDKVNLGLKVGIIVAGALAGAFLTLAAIALVSFALLALPFVALGVAIYAIYTTIKSFFQNISDAFGAAKAAFSSVASDFAAVGDALIDGIVSAIKNGASKVIGAVKGLGKSAVDAAKSVFKINSPSKVFHEIGRGTVEGFVGGVDVSAPLAAEATRDMAGGAVASASGAAGGVSASGARNNGRSLTIERIEINFAGKSADEINSHEFIRNLVSEIQLQLLSSGRGAEALTGV